MPNSIGPKMKAPCACHSHAYGELSLKVLMKYNNLSGSCKSKRTH